MPFALRALGLWKGYAAGVAGCSARAWVLRGATLEVAPGECVGILGARGAGTTTLLQCLAGLRRVDAGSIHLALEPLLVDDAAVRASSPHHLLLVDDHVDVHRRSPKLGFVRESDARTIIVATHELARVRAVADRVLLLHHGRLLSLDRTAGTRRVAERSANASAR